MDLNVKHFNDEQDAIAELMMEFCDGENAILDDDDAMKFAPTIVEAIPPSMRSEYSDNLVIAAAQFAKSYKEIVNGKQEEPSMGAGLATQKNNEVAADFDKNAMPKVSDQTQKMINKIVSEMDKETRKRNTFNSKVTKYLYKNEPLASLLGKEYVEVHPEVSPQVLNKIENNLIETKENKAEWERIKTLLHDPTSKVKAKLNDKLGRPEGVIIKTEGTGEGNNKSQEKIYNRETLISFLFFNTVLKVGSDKESGLGVKISEVKQKLVKQKTGTTTKASISITYTGQKNISPKYYDFINRPVKDAKGNFETKERSITTELAVQIYVDRMDPKTGVVKKVPGTQRIRGKFAAPIFSRDDKYVEVFGAPENRDFIDSTVTEEDFAEAQERMQMLLSLAATSGIGDVTKYGDKLTKIVNKIKDAENSTVDTGDMGI